MLPIRTASEAYRPNWTAVAGSLTATGTPAETVIAPALSVAFAVNVYDPAGTLAQANVKGPDTSSPNLVVPWKNSTLAIVPSLSVAFALMATVEPVVKPALLAGLVMLTTGATLGLLTVAAIAAEVVTALRLSVAFAVNEYVPAGTLAQAKVKGPVRSSPNLVVPWKNSTLAIVPSVSVAFAVIETVDPVAKLALLTGVVKLMAGAMLALLTVITIAVDVVTALRLSVAFAVNEYVPAGTVAQAKVKGLARSSPNLVVPWKNSTLAMVPSLSVAVELIVMVEPVVKLALLTGVVILTAGATLGLLTVMAIAVDVVTALRLSVAFAVNEYVPAGTLAQAKVKGLARSSPNLVVPWKNSTLAMVPSLSVAVELIVIVEPVVKLALLTGVVILTAGATLGVLTVMAIAVDVVTALRLSVAFAVKE